MDLAGFSVFMQHAPEMLARLLLLEGVEPTEELRKCVLEFLASLTDRDCVFFSHHSHLDDATKERLQEFGKRPGNVIQLAISLFQRYQRELAKARRHPEGRVISEEEIVFALTYGQIPLEWCFLLNDAICNWEPVSGSIYVSRIDDNQLGHACQEYLRARNPNFSSLQAAYDYARSKNWPNSGAKLKG